MESRTLLKEELASALHKYLNQALVWLLHEGNMQFKRECKERGGGGGQTSLLI